MSAPWNKHTYICAHIANSYHTAAESRKWFPYSPGILIPTQTMGPGRGGRVSTGADPASGRRHRRPSNQRSAVAWCGTQSAPLHIQTNPRHSTGSRWGMSLTVLGGQGLGAWQPTGDVAIARHGCVLCQGFLGRDRPWAALEYLHKCAVADMTGAAMR